MSPIEVEARRRRWLDAWPAPALFDAMDHRTDDLHARVSLVLGLDEVPPAERVVRAFEHLLRCDLVVRAPLPVVPVVGSELPTLHRIASPALEPSKLLLIRDVEPQ